jgi:xanthine/uracil/vitamin C permease (AzgA family)
VEQETPRLEPWFKVVLAAFAPMAAAFFLPRAAVIPMFVLAGVLLSTGLVMLIMHERKKR